MGGGSGPNIIKGELNYNAESSPKNKSELPILNRGGSFKKLEIKKKTPLTTNGINILNEKLTPFDWSKENDEKDPFEYSWSMANTSQLLFVGAPNHSSSDIAVDKDGIGAVYLIFNNSSDDYIKEVNSQKQTGYLEPFDFEEQKENKLAFGSSLELSSEKNDEYNIPKYILVGAVGHDKKGAVYIYETKNFLPKEDLIEKSTIIDEDNQTFKTRMEPFALIKAPDNIQNGQFGFSIAWSPDNTLLAIGARGVDRVFIYDTTKLTDDSEPISEIEVSNFILKWTPDEIFLCVSTDLISTFSAVSIFRKVDILEGGDEIEPVQTLLPKNLDAGYGSSMEFISADDNYYDDTLLAVGSIYSTNIDIYKYFYDDNDNEPFTYNSAILLESGNVGLTTKTLLWDIYSTQVKTSLFIGALDGFVLYCKLVKNESGTYETFSIEVLDYQNKTSTENFGYSMVFGAPEEVIPDEPYYLYIGAPTILEDDIENYSSGSVVPVKITMSDKTNVRVSFEFDINRDKPLDGAIFANTNHEILNFDGIPLVKISVVEDNGSFVEIGGQFLKFSGKIIYSSESPTILENTLFISTFFECLIPSVDYGNISTWDVSKVTTMVGMFANAVAFNCLKNEKFRSWKIKKDKPTILTSMFLNTPALNAIYGFNGTNPTETYKDTPDPDFFNQS